MNVFYPDRIDKDINQKEPNVEIADELEFFNDENNESNDSNSDID